MLLTAKVKTNDQEASPEKKLVDIPPFMMTDINAITMFDCKDGYVGINTTVSDKKLDISLDKPVKVKWI